MWSQSSKETIKRIVWWWPLPVILSSKWRILRTSSTRLEIHWWSISKCIKWIVTLLWLLLLLMMLGCSSCIFEQIWEHVILRIRFLLLLLLSWLLLLGTWQLSRLLVATHLLLVEHHILHHKDHLLHLLHHCLLLRILTLSILHHLINHLLHHHYLLLLSLRVLSANRLLRCRMRLSKLVHLSHGVLELLLLLWWLLLS